MITLLHGNQGLFQNEVQAFQAPGMAEGQSPCHEGLAKQEIFFLEQIDHGLSAGEKERNKKIFLDAEEKPISSPFL